MANNRRFSDKQLARIRELNRLGYNDSNITEIMSSTWRKISRCRKKLGLPQNSPYTEMSTKKKRKTMRESLRKNTGERMNYRTMAHELAAANLGWPGRKLGEALILYILKEQNRLETPELLNRINHKKTSKGWKPETTPNMLSYYLSGLRREGLVERRYSSGPNWRNSPRTYFITEKTYEAARNSRG